MHIGSYCKASCCRFAPEKIPLCLIDVPILSGWEASYQFLRSGPTDNTAACQVYASAACLLQFSARELLSGSAPSNTEWVVRSKCVTLAVLTSSSSDNTAERMWEGNIFNPIPSFKKQCFPPYSCSLKQGPTYSTASKPYILQLVPSTKQCFSQTYEKALVVFIHKEIEVSRTR